MTCSRSARPSASGELVGSRSPPRTSIRSWRCGRCATRSARTASPTGALSFGSDFTGFRPHERYWLLLEHGEAEICKTYPGLDEDLFITADAEAFVKWHAGQLSWAEATRDSRIQTRRSVLARQGLPDLEPPQHVRSHQARRRGCHFEQTRRLTTGPRRDLTHTSRNNPALSAEAGSARRREQYSHRGSGACASQGWARACPHRAPQPRASKSCSWAAADLPIGGLKPGGRRSQHARRTPYNNSPREHRSAPRTWSSYGGPPSVAATRHSTAAFTGCHYRLWRDRPFQRGHDGSMPSL